jgi:hypothetical protein
VTKQLVADFLTGKIREGLPVTFTWFCGSCTEQHKGNLLRTARIVTVETAIDRIRPDILLSDREGTPKIAIEVVVSHAPEPEMLAFCEKHHIQVVELHLTADADIDRLEELIANPTVVHACRNPICPTCNNRQRTKELLVIYGKCWRCQAAITVAAVNDEFMPFGPEEFSEDELRIARSHGVKLRKKFVGFDGREVWVNTCAHCPGFVGPGYLYSQFVTRAWMKEYQYESIHIGHYCPSCHRREHDDTDE